MSIFYRNIIRPLLFRQNPESIHNRTLGALKIASRTPIISAALSAFYGAPELPVECLGLRFPNPIGLAAGMDKQAEALPAWAAMGFGFTELGAVTWHPQPGNPSPRVFRIIPEQAIINRMGFNNPGAEAVAQSLQKWREQNRWPKHPVGMNLGKSKVTPLEKAAGDYANSFRVLRPLLDFFVVNVSSPNTPNLRQLQDKSALGEIFAALNQVQSSLPPSEQRPILVKVAPDLTFDALDDIVDLLGSCRIAGIVATNTTISRPATNNPEVQAKYAETGGLSGKPLRSKSTEVIAHLYRQTQGRVPIIGVGGIFTAEDAWEKIIAGASLLQVYTGFVYEGPGLCRRLVQGLHYKLKAHSVSSLQNAIGLSYAQQSKANPGASPASQQG